jgi:superfamily II DNA or RNA helicase
MQDGKEIDESYCVVYNLYYADGLEIVLPTANICNLDHAGRPSYQKAFALPENVESYGLPYTDSVHKILIDICMELSIATLEKTFNKTRKKPMSLSALFSEQQTQKTIQAIIDKRMVKFLEIIHENSLYLSFNLQRKIKASDILLSFSDVIAKPLLHFSKTQTGIKYKLNLEMEHKIISPSSYSIQFVANNPAIILLDNVVTKVERINANKIKPFLKNESIFIPDKLAKQYFEQFILDVLVKVDVEVEGFELIKTTEISGRSIRFVFDLFKDKWFFEVNFAYDRFKFSHISPSKRKNHIEFDEQGNVKVYQCLRNMQDESAFIEKIMALGFRTDESLRLTAGENKFDVFHTFGLHLSSLKDICDVEMPEIDEKKIFISPARVTTNFSMVNDWFDLSGIFMVGDQEYPISQLFSNIRSNNPYFKLRDGSFFIIPDTFFASYESIVKFAKSDDPSKWRLSKQYFNLLPEMGNIHVALGENTDLGDDFFYTPSSLLKAELRPYQIQGAGWLIRHRKNNLGACLADDMGLGKTLQTIAALVDAKESLSSHGELPQRSIQLDLFGELIEQTRVPLKALVILPASLVYNWHGEIKKYAPSLQVLRYTGPGRKKVSATLFTFDVILTTYQTAVSDLDFLKTFDFNYLILDESQQIRNKDSKVFRSLNQLTARHKISLSGTPIENSLSDLWAQMEFINPEILKTYSFFKNNYQIPIEKNRDENAIKELKLLVDPFILRRTKEQVAKDLPDLIESIHYSEMSVQQARMFEKEKSAARNFLLSLDKSHGKFKFHALSTLIKLRQIANHPIIVDASYKDESGKFEDIKDRLSTIRKSGHKVLVFSSFLSHLRLLETWLDSCSYDYVKLTGSMNSDERQKAVHDFQSKDNIQIFLLSIKAGGTGLNLTAADYVFILDPWWNPFIEKQAIARAHRIGRQNNVFVTRFISKNSIEEKILLLQSKKKNLSDDIIEEGTLPELNDNELLELLD